MCSSISGGAGFGKEEGGISVGISQGERNGGRRGREREGESGSCLSLDVGRGPQGLNLIKERRASDAVSGRRVGNGWRRKDGEFSIESRAKSGTPL